MTHLTTTQLLEPGAKEIQHLEGCSACRRLVTTDVDVKRVRHVVMALLDEPDVGPRKIEIRPVWALVGVAALVLAVFVPLVWVGLGGETPTLTQPTDPVVLPPPSDHEPPDPPAPPPGSESDSFEMTFESGDGVYGRLIWAGEDFYEGLRASGEGGFDYSFYAADSFGTNTREMNPFPPDAEGDPIAGSLPTGDSRVPWQILLTRMTPEEMWEAIGGGTVSEAEPTHFLATGGLSDGTSRLEWNEAGMPVLVDTPTIGVFRVIELTFREIRAGEVGNNVDLPFMFALHLAANSPPEQRIVLVDGIVTFADYAAAAERAANCAQVDVHFGESSGMFILGESPELDGCREQFLDDIEAVWRVDSKWLGMDEHALIDAIIEGRDDLVELYSAEPGPELPLASGEGWAISIRERGPGFCFRYGVGGTTGNITQFSGAGCATRDSFAMEALFPLISNSYDENGPLRADLFGLVSEEVDRIVISFESGEPIELRPGDRVELGLRGFGYPLLDISERGEPTTIEVFDGSVLLGTYSHTEGRAIES